MDHGKQFQPSQTDGPTPDPNDSMSLDELRHYYYNGAQSPSKTMDYYHAYHDALNTRSGDEVLAHYKRIKPDRPIAAFVTIAGLKNPNITSEHISDAAMDVPNYAYHYIQDNPHIRDKMSVSDQAMLALSHRAADCEECRESN